MKSFISSKIKIIQYWLWRFLENGSEKKVKKILTDMGMQEHLQNPQYLEKIRKLCSKERASEYLIAQKIIDDILTEKMLKDPSLNHRQKNKVGRELKGEGFKPRKLYFMDGKEILDELD